MTAEERLEELVVGVLRDQRPMTEKQIVNAIYRRAKITTDEHSVRIVLSHTGRFSRIRPRFQLFRHSNRWRLVEAGPATDQGNAGAPVPAWPYRPTLSGAAAVPLNFRDDEPPTNATGRLLHDG
jgi:hypothetical protein